jgi:ubiquinone/menaquinone biosynthesis C-methylase UbiE
MNKAQIFWDKQAKKFDDGEKNYELASGVILDTTKEYLNANDIVLDFGCATGTKTLKLAETVRYIHGLDFSVEMIREATKKKDKGNVNNVAFSQGTVFNEDFKKTSFDKVIAFAIIHLMEDSEKAIQRIHELLRPGGLFISTTACFKEKMDFKIRLTFTSYRFMKRLGFFPLHLNMFKTSDLELLINRNNFIILKAEKLFFNGMTISFIVAEKNNHYRILNTCSNTLKKNISPGHSLSSLVDWGENHGCLNDPSLQKARIARATAVITRVPRLSNHKSIISTKYPQ